MWKEICCFLCAALMACSGKNSEVHPGAVCDCECETSQPPRVLDTRAEARAYIPGDPTFVDEEFTDRYKHWTRCNGDSGDSWVTGTYLHSCHVGAGCLPPPLSVCFTFCDKNEYCISSIYDDSGERQPINCTRHSDCVNAWFCDTSSGGRKCEQFSEEVMQFYDIEGDDAEFAQE